MTWVLWASFATVSAINIITPGPANLNTCHRAVQLGVRRIFPTIMGNSLGLAVGGGACGLGLASFAASQGPLWTLFQALGTGYLVWLGAKLVWASAPPPIINDCSAPRAKHLFLEAFSLAVTNPKALLFYLAVLPQAVEREVPIAPQIAILVLTYCVFSILSLSAYASVAHLARAHLLTSIRFQVFRRICGALLLIFAARLLRDLIHTLL